MKILVHIIFVFILISCRKDETVFHLANSITFELETIDTSGNLQSNFDAGNNVGFRITMKNISPAKIHYFEGIKCGRMKFKIYCNDTLVGVPHPENLGCEDILVLESIDKNESKSTSIYWNENPINIPLASGNYKVVFSSKIAINESDKIEIGNKLDWIEVIAEKEFIVQ